MTHTYPKKSTPAVRRMFAFTLVFALLVTGCGSGSAAKSIDSPWVDSDVTGFVTAADEYRPQDDFAAFTNKDWILEGGSAGSVYDIAGSVLDKKRALLDNKSVQSRDMEEIRKYASLVEDWDSRNSIGVEPLRKYLEKIEAISDLDAFYGWICSTEDNPLSIAPLEVSSVMQSPADPTSYITYLNYPSFSLGKDPDSYFDMTDTTLDTQETVINKVTYILDRLGCSSSDIKRILKDNFKMEKRMAKDAVNLTSDEVRDLSYSRSDLEESAGDYPLLKFLDARGFEDTQTYLMAASYVRQLHRICAASDISELRAFLIVQYVLKAGKYLDREAFDRFSEEDRARKQNDTGGETASLFSPEDSLLFNSYIAENPVIMAAFNREYVNRYTDPDSHGRLLEMTEKIIETYHTVFNNEDWLSDEGKAACIEKLDAIKIHIIYPDDDIDLSALDITPASEGGNLLDTTFETQKMYMKKLAERSVLPYDRNYWDPYDPSFSTTETNASYVPTNNGIYIYAGILENPVYYHGITDEELYGAIGAVVGHEITHGFDKDGSRYDKDGLELQWLPEGDQQAFLDRSDMVSHYYSTLSPYPGSGLYNGQQVSGEATADMGGLRVTLKIAEGIPGFDYDSYFRAFARFFRTQVSLERETYLFKNDVHPLDFLRINVGLQQFDKFYEIYDVKPGDGMYLEEDRRIAVW